MPYLALVGNAMIWGLSWWPLRQLQAMGLHPLWATSIFFVLSTGLVMAWRPSALAVLLRSPALWCLALAAGSTNAAFNWGVSVGEVVRVVLLFYLMPVWAALLAWLTLGERPTSAAAFRVALALLGAVLVLKPADAPWPVFAGLPDVLGLVGGFGFAANNVILRQQVHQDTAARALAMFMGGILLPGCLAVVLSSQGVIPPLPAFDARWLFGALALGLLMFCGNMALQYGASRVPVNISSVVMLTEIVFAAGSAVWWGGEVLTPIMMAGGGLILLAAVLASREGSTAHAA
ncbi:DMT family transporter [Aquabacterium sp.]|uniref:DMT family transporter n=1 Tax=Aquabacterium sp. TaxID=1872578 RepID=UPI0019C67EC4|nr:DMT family transporter [Aquabacterium sp.]MBC7700576.1 DMT family transporter [Aquabacterium sp.]